MPDRTCSMPGCNSTHRARGLCGSHYQQIHQLDRHSKRTARCAGCGADVQKYATQRSRRFVCSYRCRYFVTYGRWPEAGRELVGPVARRLLPTLKPQAQPNQEHETRSRFVSVACGWCGGYFVQDLRITGVTARWCSRYCQRKSHKATRRAVELGAAGTYTWAEVMRLYLKFGGCAYCGGSEDIQPDHVVPLSRGGSNSITNVVPACGPCNSDKGSKSLAEWYASRQTRGLAAVALTAAASHLTWACLAS
jgi:5-methylcytosine-specific restriction endonuclease McrA